MLFVFLSFHNTYSRKPLHEYNFGKTNVVGKEDIGYIEALKQHGTDYEDANEEEEVYEYQHESDFRSGGLDAEVRCEKFSISLSSRSVTVANRTSKLEMMQ